MNELAKTEPTPPTPLALFQKVIEGGITPESVAVAQGLLDFQLRVNAIDAEHAFDAAFAQLQAELPEIRASKEVCTGAGKLMYRYEPLERIQSMLSPYLKRHGFGIRFNSENQDGRITGICEVSHIKGHKRVNRVTVREGKWAPGSNDAQADGGSVTFAQRHALCDAFGLIIHRDTDASVGPSSDFISTEEAEDFRYRFEALNNGKPSERALSKFLEWAGAKSFETIPASEHQRVADFLTRKESERELSGPDKKF